MADSVAEEVRRQGAPAVESCVSATAQDDVGKDNFDELAPKGTAETAIAPRVAAAPMREAAAPGVSVSSVSVHSSNQ